MNVAKQFPNYTIYDSGPVNIVGSNVEICAPVVLFPGIPAGVGLPSPVTPVLPYNYLAVPAGGSAGRGNFDWDRGLFYAEHTPSAGQPNYNNDTVTVFNIATQAIVGGPHAATHLGEAAFNSGLGTRTAMGFDGNLYFASSNSGWTIGRLNTTSWLADADFATAVEAAGDITVVQSIGLNFVVYCSATSGTVGCRIYAVQMDGVVHPVQVGTAFTVDEAPGSIGPPNVVFAKGPPGRCYGVAFGDSVPNTVTDLMGVYAFNVGALFQGVKIGVIHPAQVYPSWTVFAGYGSMVYDETDGNLIIELTGAPSNLLVKINTTTAAVMWTLPVYGNNEFRSARIKGGRFNLPDGPNAARVMLYINTLTGTVLSSTPILGTLNPNTYSTSDTAGQVVIQTTFGAAISQWATFGPALAPPMASVGDIIQIGCGKVLVTAVTNPGDVTGKVLIPITNQIPGDPSGATTPVPPGSWSVATPTALVANLWHLEGKQVLAVADGCVLGPFTVTNGSVTLPFPATNIVVGLSYTAQLQTLYLEAPGGQGRTMQGERKQVPACSVRVADTRGIKIGRNFSDLQEMDGLMGLTGGHAHVASNRRFPGGLAV